MAAALLVVVVVDIARGFRARCRSPSLLLLGHCHFSRLLAVARTVPTRGAVPSTQVLCYPAVIFVEPGVGCEL